MIQLRFVPIEKWPGVKTVVRKHDQFRASYLQTLDLLETELGFLRAREIILQAFISWRDLRNDGLPRGDAQFSDPGVILTFESRNGTLSFPCDTYHYWQANLRAIGLSLEALRAVNRYGVTRHAEQYQGWLKIAPPAGKMDRETAAVFLAGHGLESTSPADRGNLLRDADFRQSAYRRAAAKLHPDKPGGTTEEFTKLQEAMRILEGK